MRADLPGRHRAAAHASGDRASQLLTARLLASIIESSDDAIISKSLDGIIQSWNAAAERLFGYTAEQAIGRHISLIIPPDRIAEEDHIIASLKAGRRIEHFETERVRVRRPPHPRLADHLADQGRRGRRRRRVEDRAGRHAASAQAERARTPAAGGSGGGQRQVPRVLRAGRAFCRHHGRGRHAPRGQPPVVGSAADSPRSRSSASRSGKVRGGRRRRSSRSRSRPRHAQAAAGADVSRRDAVLRRRRQRAGGRRHDPADPRRHRPGDVSRADRRRHHRPQTGRGRPAEVRDARREQHRLHRHVRSRGRAVLRQPRRVWRWSASTTSRQARRAPVAVLLLPGRSTPDHERVLSVGPRNRATARSKCASGTSRPATRAGWPTRC